MRTARPAYAIALVAAVVLSAAVRITHTEGVAKAAGPSFQFDPAWPKPLPNNWVVGNVVGVAVDSKDNIWMVHRPNSQTGADKTPPVLEFDQAGSLLASWGGRAEGVDWG